MGWILEVWWMFQHIFIFLLTFGLKITFLKCCEGRHILISTRCGTKDLPSFKKCITLNIWFIYDCLVIGFGTSFFDCFGFPQSFHQWSIPYFVHLLPALYNLGSWQHNAIKQFSFCLCISVCRILSYPSIHSSIYLIYIHPSLPFLISQTSVAHCYVHMFLCATFIFGKHQSNSIHMLIDYNLLLTHKYPIFSLSYWIHFAYYTVVIHSSRVPWA